MSIESVKAFFAAHAPDLQVIELDVSTATVELAAAGHGVAPGQIAKTLAIRVGDEVALLAAKGTARLDNRKFKARFSTKPRMLPLDEVERETGHPVGGVCPFGLAKPLKVYCDISLQAYDEVVPAAGAINAAVRISPARMAQLTGAEWIDVCE
ncbi:MAG: YbaK/EbsC family protein [Rhizobiaceae bacterium]|nr:YbaK/EbsC family protein [Rhizobiaceae bacterium]